MNKISMVAQISQPVTLSSTRDDEPYCWVWYSVYNDIGQLELNIGEPMYGQRAVWACQNLRQGQTVLVDGRIVEYHDRWSNIYKYKVKSERLELIA